jgi:hypothetical protein
MKKRFLIILVLAVGFISVNAKATMTIATFDDPSANSGNPLFTVDLQNNLITGGWGDDKTGLTLDIPYSGNTFTDAWFTMTEVVIVAHAPGDTGGGEINFYADGSTTGPLLAISFGSGHVDYHNLGADGIFIANNVAITGSEIGSVILSEVEFSFGFANLAYLEDSENWNDGFTATATFDSSAVPEPATIALLGLGALSLIGRKKRKGGMQAGQ